MIIKEVKYTHFNLKLKTQFKSSKQILNTREGYILSLTDELGNIGLGECSPLPEFSKETLAQAQKNLHELRLSKIQLVPDLFAISNQFSAINLTASGRFAFEQAILSLLINRSKNKNIILETFGNLKPQVNINAVFGFDKSENIIKEIFEKIRLGYNTFKIKIGRPNFDEDFSLIKNIRNKFGEAIYLRLDASGKWNLEDAKHHLKSLSAFNIQYIEEPCSGFNLLQTISHNSPIPVAVDESIRTITQAIHVINDSKIEFIVLKPMILGGILSSLQLIKTAESKNKKIIISSSFESVIGKSVLVLLAACSQHNFAHGLGTSELFFHDVSKDYYPVLNGRIKFDSQEYPPKFSLYQS